MQQNTHAEVWFEITLRHGCSLVNLLHIFKTPFPENTYRRLLLNNRFPLITDNIVTNVWALLFPMKELYTAQAGILLKLCESVLTLWRPMFPSYRNRSVDLLCKSADWFLYDGNIGRQRVLRIIVLHHCKVTWEILVSVIFPLWSNLQNRIVTLILVSNLIKMRACYRED